MNMPQTILAAFHKGGPKFLKSVHAKCISYFLEAAEEITINKLSDAIKIAQLFVLLEGFIAYLVQFSFDHDLINYVIKLRNEYWINNGNLPPNSFASFNRVSIQKTCLLFAKIDGFLTTDLIKQVNYNFGDTCPWEICSLDDTKEESSTLVIAQNYDPTLKMPPLIEGGHFSPALNETGGFILSRLDPYTEAFVTHAVASKGTVLNIGSGYGIPERIALHLGAEKVICNDVSDEQLKLIEALTPNELKSRLKLLPGTFPKLVLPPKSIQVMGIFRVLHFFNPEMLEKAIDSAYNLLEPGGILIISAETPYLANWQRFIPEYEQNVKMGVPNPGYIADTSKYETAGYSRRLPPRMHFLDPNVLTLLLTKNDRFIVEKCSTFDRSGTFPKELLLDGKESVGVIARKPLVGAVL